MCKEVVIIGAGGHGKVIADIAEKSGDKVIGFLDDSCTADKIIGIPIIGKTEKCIEYKDKYFFIAIGNNAVRKKIAEKYSELKYYTAIHPSASIGLDVVIGDGTCLMANTVVNSSAKIGKHCIINTNTAIEHDCVLEDYVHISPGSAICGTVHIGSGTHIGAGVSVINNHNICENVIVGAGGAVCEDIVESGTYVGVPAKKIK